MKSLGLFCSRSATSINLGEIAVCPLIHRSGYREAMSPYLARACLKISWILEGENPYGGGISHSIFG